MGRVLIPAAVALALLVAVSSSHAQAPDCVDGAPPPQPAAGTGAINPPAPVVNDDILIVGDFSDNRPYVEGSMRTKVTRPDGTTATFRSEDECFTPAEVGDYVATVTATYVGCAQYGQAQYVTDTAGPTPFKVVAGRDPKLF